MTPLLSDFAWDSLLRAIGAGRCIPFVGAGASSPPLPTASQLCERLCQRFGVPAFASSDLGKAAEFIQLHYRREGHYQLICFVKDVLKTHPGPNEAHLNLARLPWHTLITTNYDAFISQSLIAAGKNPTIYSLLNQEGQVGSSISEPRDWRATAGQPLVVHIHGALPEDRDIVISESDYYTYLANMSSGVWSLPGTVLHALASSSYLFVGYSVRDWTLRLLFHSLQRFIQKDHFALVFLRDDNEGEARYMAEYLQRFVDAQVFFGDAQSFTAELRERWDRHDTMA